MNHGVNFGWDVNSAHVSIVIYLRLQGTSVQTFIYPLIFHILYALLNDYFEHFFFLAEKKKICTLSDPAD